jgi:Transcriptional regulatory protein, C terminal
MADLGEPPAENLVLGGLEIDLAGHLATFQGRTLQLSSSQFELLAILVANHRRVVSRSELSERLGLERGRSVDVMLSMLRRQLGCDFVRNVRKRGWIVIPEALAPCGPSHADPPSEVSDVVEIHLPEDRREIRLDTAPPISTNRRPATAG